MNACLEVIMLKLCRKKTKVTINASLGQIKIYQACMFHGVEHDSIEI